MILKEKRFLLTPNRITAIRLLLTAAGLFILAVFPSFPGRLSAFLILFAAAWSDILDGYLARFQGLETDTGKILDPIADKLLILGVMAVFGHLRLYSYLWVLLFAFREIAVTVTRISLLKRGRVIAAEHLGKIKTVSQMVSLLVTFLYLFIREDLVPAHGCPDWLFHGFFFANYIFLIAAFLLTYVSGISFFRRLRAEG